MDQKIQNNLWDLSDIFGHNFREWMRELYTKGELIITMPNLEGYTSNEIDLRIQLKVKLDLEAYNIAKEYFEYLSIENLDNTGFNNFGDFNMNFYKFFTGEKISNLKRVLNRPIIPLAGHQFMELRFAFAPFRGMSLGKVIEIIEETIISSRRELDIKEEFSPEFITEKVMSKNLKELLGENLSEEDLRIKQCLNLMILAYKKFRRLGWDDMRDLYM